MRGALTVPAEPHDICRDLAELIEAIDRRLPQIAHAGETVIADEAAALRARAVKRLAALSRVRVSTPGITGQDASRSSDSGR